MNETRLVRSETDRMIAGVCGGLAAYLGIDSVLVRIAFVVLLLASGIGLPIYLILWVVMPIESQAQRSGAGYSRQDVNDAAAFKESRVSRAWTVGVVLILFGLFFLFNQMGWFGNALFPILLIGAGVFFLFRRVRQE